MTTTGDARPRRRMLGAIAAAAVLSGLIGCDGNNGTLTILSKGFTEQAILSEMTAELLREHGSSARIRTVADSYEAHAALRGGSADLMVDYSGTALNLLGESAGVRPSSVDRARERYRPIGLDWLDPLGFENGYAVVVTADRASAQGLRSIEDLADTSKFPNGVRVACHPEFLRRPGDGLGPLSEAYGFRLSGAPLVEPDVVERMRALEGRRVDVAIGFTTDGLISALGLQVLGDSMGFFPEYEAAFVLRGELKDRAPAVVEVLGMLSGRIDDGTMRRLSAEVDVKGRRPIVVAREFLIDEGLIDEDSRAGSIPERPDLALAIDERDDFYELRGRALVSIRRTFPNRSVTELFVKDPAEAVARGRARLALLGAERFFRDREGEESPERETRIEAVAVVGTRLVHLVRKAGDGAEDPLSGRVGVPPAGSGRGRIARRILGPDREPAASGTPVELLEMVRGGELDAALLLLPVGDLEFSPEARELMASGLELRALGGWLTPSRAVRVPYLRPARFASGSYPGQSEPIETLGVQVLLAGPAPRGAASLTVGSGPAAALNLAGLPLEPDEIQDLAASTGVPEAPDPTLPSAWSRGVPDPDESFSTLAAVFSTILNVLALVYLAWVIRLAIRPAPDSSS